MAAIAAAGQLTPILATPGAEPGKYHSLSGHRRCAALRFLGATTVKAIVRTDLDERDARKIALADNLGREDLTAFEQANALQDYCKAFNVSIEAAAEELGLRRRTAFRLKTILAAPEAVQFAIRERGISARGAELLAKIAVRWPRRAVRLADKFADGSLSLKALENEARDGSGRVAPGAGEDADLQDVVLKVEPQRLTLKLDLKREARTDRQLTKVADALAQVLGHLRIARVDAAQVEALSDEG